MTGLTTTYTRGTLVALIGDAEIESRGAFALDALDDTRVLRWNARRGVWIHVAATSTVISFVSDFDRKMNGLVVCLCGAKYWESGRCIDCGSKAPR